VSQKITAKIEIKDKAVLVETLKEMGFKVCESLDAVTKIRKNVELLLKRSENRSLYGDVQFERTENGFIIHMDSSDKIKVSKEKITQIFCKNRLKKAISNKPSKYGFISEKVDEKGNIKMKVKVRNI
jgi:hypothetical protein